MKWLVGSVMTLLDCLYIKIILAKLSMQVEHVTLAKYVYNKFCVHNLESTKGFPNGTTRINPNLTFFSMI